MAISVVIDGVTYEIPTTGEAGWGESLDAYLLALGNHLGVTLTLAAVGSSPNANAATISGTLLNLEPASASFPGVVTVGSQTIAGAKTLTSPLTVALGSVVDAITVTATGGTGSTVIAPTALGGRMYNGNAQFTLDYSIGTTMSYLDSSVVIDNIQAKLTGGYADGPTAVATVLRSANPLTDSGSKIASFKNVSTEKAFVGYSGTFGSLAASGSDGIKILDGARLNLSTADTNSYLFREGAGRLGTPATYLKLNTDSAAGQQVYLSFDGTTVTRFIKYAPATTSFLMGGVSYVAVDGYFNSQASSGNTAFKSVDGARWNLSTGDTSAYLYRSSANVLSTPGTIDATHGTFGDVVSTGQITSNSNSSSSAFFAANNGYWTGGAGGPMTFRSENDHTQTSSSIPNYLFLPRYTQDSNAMFADFRQFGGASLLAIYTDGLGCVTSKVTANNSASAFYMATAGAYFQAAGSAYVISDLADGASSIGLQFTTSAAWSNAGAELLELQNNRNARFAVGFSGMVKQYGSITTAGAATVDKPIGIAKIANTASSVTITNALVDENSHIIITPLTDVVCAVATRPPWVTRGSGTFTINTSAAVSQDTAFAWEVKKVI